MVVFDREQVCRAEQDQRQMGIEKLGGTICPLQLEAGKVAVLNISGSLVLTQQQFATLSLDEYTNIWPRSALLSLHLSLSIVASKALLRIIPGIDSIHCPMSACRRLQAGSIAFVQSPGLPIWLQPATSRKLQLE